MQEYATQTVELAKEGTRVSRGIHDTLGHTLTNMVMPLHAIQSVIEIEPVRVIKEVREVMHQARNGKKGVQRWIMILREEPMHLARGRSRFKEQRPSSPPGYEKIGHFYLDT